MGAWRVSGWMSARADWEQRHQHPTHATEEEGVSRGQRTNEATQRREEKERGSRQHLEGAKKDVKRPLIVLIDETT